MDSRDFCKVSSFRYLFQAYFSINHYTGNTKKVKRHEQVVFKQLPIFYSTDVYKAPLAIPEDLSPQVLLVTQEELCTNTKK